jgi:3-methyl-2-oxobutanoate hydroxymethyltransferase
MRAKPTVADLRAHKGSKQRSMLFVLTPEEAAAADEAEIDMLSIHGGIMSRVYRKAAPNTFIMSGIRPGTYVGADEAVRRAYELMEAGADAVYCVHGITILSRLAEEGVPVVSHVGLIPSKATWTGGFKAVGKTAESALMIWNQVQRLASAGVFGAEIEVVPDAVATEISKRTSVFMISMGAGKGCDAQYLFADDVLGITTGHVPRHAKQYRNFTAEFDRLQRERVAAFREYRAEIDSGHFPDRSHLVGIDDAEMTAFLQSVGKSLG